MSQLRNKPTDYITNVALETYSCEKDFLGVLEKHKEDIRCLSYIVHDKDEADTHIHAIFALSRSLQVKTICGWFKKCSDVEGVPCNTFAEEILSASAMEDYLTHSGEGQEGKHQYQAEDVKVLEAVADARRSLKGKEDVKRENAEKKAERKAEQADETESLLNDLIARRPMRELARKYGRDFMKNHRTYMAFAIDVQLEEGTITLEEALARGDSILAEKAMGEARKARSKGFYEGVAVAFSEILEEVGDRIGHGDSFLRDLEQKLRKMEGVFYS